MLHKSGFVNIIGNPNVGKSTLMNALVGENLSIITSKAQTTRHRIMGIVNGDNYQIVYSDTPGIIKPNYLLQKQMMKFVDNAIEDADLFLLVTEIGEEPYKNSIFDKVNGAKKPVLLVLNKVDLSNPAEVGDKLAQWEALYPEFKLIAASALHKIGLNAIFDTILQHLPFAPEYFPKDELTDRPLRFFISEIIREKILLNYHQEIPYCTEVIVDTYKEEVNIIKIAATIYVARDSQKGILIGEKGSAIKRLGTQAREDIEKFVDKKVFLELFVKVNKDWRDDEKWLRRFGYIST